jgi:hypothetical protein
MRSITALLVAAFASMLLISAPATAASDACNATQSMCSVPADTPIRLAADYSVTPKSGAKVASSQCRGKFGVELRKCKCEAKGESGLPCRFTAAHFPVPEQCSCQ